MDLVPRLKYRKGLALLAFLAVNSDRWVPRQQLAALLWPALTGPAALTNLRQVLNTLMRVLNGAAGATLIASDRERVGWFSLPQVSLDIALLSQTQTAWDPSAGADDSRANQLIGEFLQGFDLAACEAFEAWLRQTRQELDASRHLWLKARCEAQLSAGNSAAAALTARRIWEADPLNEPAAAQLMRLLLAVGDRRGAQSVLSQLDQQMLTELGSKASRAVRSLLDRQAPALSEQEGARPASFAPPDALSELRWLTVLYVEFQALGEEPGEEADALLPPLMHRAQVLLRRWGGLTQWVFGQGFHASFGGQTGQEHAALRSLLAGRELLRALGDQAGLRIGICAGQALCTHTAQDFGLVGDLPARARHLAAEAGPGQMLLAHELQEQLNTRYAFREQAPVAGGGGKCYALDERSGTRPARTEQAHPLVGRADALQVLQACWQRAQAGQPQFVMLRGEAGLGKTALASAFARRFKALPVKVRFVRCGLEHQHRPLWPLHQALFEPRGIDAECGPAPDPELEAGNTPSLDVKEALFASLIAVLDRWCLQGPTLICIDDLHWSDLGTRELLSRYISLFDAQALMLLVTTRPEIALEAVGTAPVLIDLAPLMPAEAEALAAQHDVQGRLTPDLLARVARDSGGNPLYIEGLTRKLLNHDLHSQVPMTELLQAELDRLGPFKPVIQTAAVLGQQFDAAVLQRLLPGQEVEAVLQLAEGHRLLDRIGPADRISFRHALIRDAAYASLPPLQRRQVHGLLADQLSVDTAAAPGEVARHYVGARRWALAVRWWQRAGRQALALEFAADALQHFQRGLDLSLSHGLEDVVRGLRLEVAGAALKCQGYGSPLAYQQFGLVCASIDALPRPDADEREARFLALSGLYMGADSQGQNQGLSLAQRLLALAESPAERLMAAFALGNSLFWQGRFDEALRHQQDGVELARALSAEARQRHTGDDLGVLLHAFQCWTCWFLGDSTTGREVAERGIALARLEGKVHTLCFMLTFAAALHWTDQTPEASLQVAGEGLALATRYGFPLWQGINGLFCLAAKAELGELADIAPVQQAAQTMREAYQAGTTTARWIVAGTMVRLGQLAEAEPLLAQTLDDALTHQAHYCRAELLRLLAHCLSARGAKPEAEARLEQARTLAEQQGARGLLAWLDATAPAPGSAAVADPAPA